MFLFGKYTGTTSPGLSIFPAVSIRNVCLEIMTVMLNNRTSNPLFFNSVKSFVINVVFPKFFTPLTARIRCFFCLITKSLLPSLLLWYRFVLPAFQSDSYSQPYSTTLHWNEDLLELLPFLRLS